MKKSGEKAARKAAKQDLQDLLGRKPTKAEMDKYLKDINANQPASVKKIAAEQSHPLSPFYSDSVFGGHTEPPPSIAGRV